MIVFTEFICKRKGLSNKSLKLEITPVRVQTLTRVKSLKKDLLDSPFITLSESPVNTPHPREPEGDPR